TAASPAFVRTCDFPRDRGCKHWIPPSGRGRAEPLRFVSIRLRASLPQGGVAMKKYFSAAWLGLGVFLALSAPPALADDFYAGRTITFIVGSGVGGGYDLQARLAARHLGKHIPG